MIVHDDGCVCEFCTLLPEKKVLCPTFLFVTGIQRAACAFVPLIPPTGIRIEVTECVFAFPTSVTPKSQPSAWSVGPPVTEDKDDQKA